MYGLVNKGLEDLVRKAHGDAVWQRICLAAGLEEDTFSTMRSYPDAVTYALVGAASRELGHSATELLEAFGEHWVLYTGREGYGPLFAMAGRSVEEVLTSLDSMHGRIAYTFPELRMPEFTCSRLADGALRLEYRSTREGLAPMVIGLVRGLGKHFHTPVTIRHTVVRGAGAEHDEFELHVAAS